MDIKRAGSRPSAVGPEAYFTGTVQVDSIIEAPAPSRIRSVVVTFEPNARTAWHTHPVGQALLILSGEGRAQKQGGPIEDLHPGDVVWFEPGEKHWHGAAPQSAMSHLAVQEVEGGSAVTWLEPVTDQQYNGKSEV
jgi:quercetin dioxygenase-like cupin family protein